MLREVTLLLGTDLGNRTTNLSSAISEIDHHFENIIRSSSIYETQAWGFESKNHFLNQIVLIQTSKSPFEVLDIILSIETKLGRSRNPKKKTYESRIIDIDILFFEDLIIRTKKLELPHPQLHKRKFTLIVLEELNKDFIHPVYQQAVSQLLLKCKDNLWVKKYVSE
jgi:2-amino-4-hydroxy-6-hydroxymethyldihydropteridine diphosphokinase